MAVGQLQDAGSRQDVTVLGETAEEVGVGFDQVVAVFAHAWRFLRHVVNVSVHRLSLVEILRPGHSVANCERIAPHVMGDISAELFDDADDLVPQDAGTGTLVRMNVGPADGGHGDTHQGFVRLNVTNRVFPDHKRRVRRLVYDGTAWFRHLIIQCFYAVPLIAKSKISWLLSPPAAPRSA